MYASRCFQSISSPSACAALLVLSMGESRAEDKPKRERWSRRNLQWERAFEYFDYTAWERSAMQPWGCRHAGRCGVPAAHRGILRDGRNWSWCGVSADAWNLKVKLAAQGVPHARLQGRRQYAAGV